MVKTCDFCHKIKDDEFFSGIKSAIICNDCKHDYYKEYHRKYNNKYEQSKEERRLIKQRYNKNKKVNEKVCDYCNKTKLTKEFSKIRTACICNNCRERYLLDRKHEKNVEWYKNNKDESDAHTKEYRETHKDHLNALARKRYNDNPKENREKQRTYRNKNKDKINANKRNHWNKNKDKINANRRDRYLINRDKILTQVKTRVALNRNKINEGKRHSYLKHRKEILAKQKYKRENMSDEDKLRMYQIRHDYYERNKETIINKVRSNYKTHCDKIRKRVRLYKRTPQGKLVIGRSGDKRKRSLGREPINEWFIGSAYHHLHYDREGNPNNSIGMYIPRQLHNSVWHNSVSGIGIEEINKLSWKWYDTKYK